MVSRRPANAQTGRAARLLWPLGLSATAVVVAMAVLLVAHALGTSHSGDWRPLGLQGVLVHSIALSATDPLTIAAGTENGIFERHGTGGWARVLPRSEIWSIAAGSAGRLLAGAEDGEVFSSPGTGRGWRGRRLPTASVYAVSFDPAASSVALAGGVGGIFRSHDGGRDWRRVAALGRNACDALRWIGPRTVLAGIVSGPSGRLAPAVLISRNGGRAWQALGSGLPRAGVMSLIADRQSLLAGSMGQAVWKLAPGAGRWVRSATNMPSTEDHGAALIRIGGRIRSFYVGTLGFGVFRSRNGVLWRQDSSGLGGGNGSEIVLALAYDRQSGSLLAGTADGVWQLSESMPPAAGRASPR